MVALPFLQLASFIAMMLNDSMCLLRRKVSILSHSFQIWNMRRLMGQ